MSRWLVSLALLTATYLMVLGSVAPWDVLMGALLSGVLLAGTQRFLFTGRPAPLPDLLGRIVALVPFSLMVLFDIVEGTWMVVLVVLRLRPLHRPGIVEVPIGERSPTGVAVSGIALTLSPGSYLVDIDWERDIMLYHVLDATEPEQIREKYEAFYQRYQRRVFP
ncbi:MAG: Na+/H+ antiporter subunit E [Chloroflexota bacterium]|nr:Na+/H+ antiporter subunit E [Chloroflexota bacterium]